MSLAVIVFMIGKKKEKQLIIDQNCIQILVQIGTFMIVSCIECVMKINRERESRGKLRKASEKIMFDKANVFN